MGHASQCDGTLAFFYSHTGSRGRCIKCKVYTVIRRLSLRHPANGRKHNKQTKDLNMKTITTLSLAALAATLMTGAAFAHEPSSPVEWRFDAHGNRFPIYVPDKSPTLAVYVDRQGFGFVQRGPMNQ